MATYFVGYDLRAKGEGAYDDLEAAIERLGPSWHHLDSSWFVVTDLSTAEVRDRLMRHIKAGDKLLVVRSGTAWACTGGFTQPAKDWLREHVSGTA